MRREELDVWVAIALVLLFSLYHLCITFAGAPGIFALLHPSALISTFLQCAVVWWFLGLLWAAYRQWMATPITHASYTELAGYGGPEVLMLLDGRDRVIECNSAVSNTLGYEVNDVMNRPVRTFFEEMKSTKKGQKKPQSGIQIGEAIGVRKDGEMVPIEMIKAKLKHDDESVVVMQDITERKQMEDELEQARREIEVIRKSRDDAICALRRLALKNQEESFKKEQLGHLLVQDIMTPLHEMKKTQAAMAEKLTEKQRDKIEAEMQALTRSTKELELMIQSVRDVDELEDQKLPIREGVCDMEMCVWEAMKAVGAIRGSRQVSFKRQTDLAPLRADAAMIQRVMANLLAFAMQAAPRESGILVSLTEQNDLIKIAISYAGPLIESKVRDRLFDKMSQSDLAREHAVRAPGLELPYCKMAIEAHRGQIWIDSESGYGNSIRVALPRRN